MEKQSLVQIIESTASEILQQKKAVNKDEAVLLPEIVAAFKQRQSNINESTLSAYLSKLARSGTSSIRSAGKKRGFFISPVTLATADATQALPVEAVIDHQLASIEHPSAALAKGREPRQMIEKKLYQMIKEWLETESYSVAVTADKTANGKWGNPDVTGIKVIDTVSENKEIEIITIEIKPNVDQWKQFIFEAVSHTRFANLSYYCFAYPESSRNGHEQELYLYAEEFGIGLLGIEMEDADYQNFLINQYEPKFEDVEIIEIQTPRLKFLRPYFREKFLESLGISCLKDLILWPGKAESLKSAS